MERIKGLVFNRGKIEYQGKEYYSYLLACHVITEEPLNIENDTIIMGGTDFTNPIADTLDYLKKYKPPFPLGELGLALLRVCKMSPSELEEIS